ncbi:MAG: hypothetical protein EAZ32_05130 [Cytophagia bacterium]|nr:MAG: hypothetical protein EAZ46_03170 [Runella sp.]TAG21584.1 MAG: hypothetical protein EAZ38_07740 [Cytophagales bacterium]TAG40847.1 MAG: hypothetical protein EAZ32_05130 [Cytophagia bacterium]TAG52919.1 MAG: hypothetical protein EAZ29_06415 [Runella slithyformis]TAG82387.1 MAG: hypothetical protein EAZ22_05340 [Cytophagales bacterium]
MKHYTTSDFWESYQKLPISIQKLADKNYELLKADPEHPSLHLKHIGELWSVRIGLNFRALGLNNPEGIIWFWIGSHADYDKLIEQQ